MMIDDMESYYYLNIIMATISQHRPVTQIPPTAANDELVSLHSPIKPPSHPLETEVLTEAAWTEVAKKSKSRNNAKRKQHARLEAVIVQAEGLSYSDMLKKIKADKEVLLVSTNFSTVSMTKATLEWFLAGTRKTEKKFPEHSREL